jgi:hypothetical protein
MKFPEKFRANHPALGPSKAGDRFGHFEIPGRHAKGRALRVMANDGEGTGWCHVSVSLIGWEGKCPSWDEMCVVKDLFFDKEECVVQFHAPESKHVNIHPGCLHLWKKDGEDFPMPPKVCV